MENLKDIFGLFYEIFMPFLKVVIAILLVGVLMNVLTYYVIKVEESNLDKIKYCPSCGIDLIEM